MPFETYGGDRPLLVLMSNELCIVKNSTQLSVVAQNVLDHDRNHHMNCISGIKQSTVCYMLIATVERIADCTLITLSLVHFACGCRLTVLLSLLLQY